MITTTGYIASMTVTGEVEPEVQKNFKVNAYNAVGQRKSLIGYYPNMINLDTARFEDEKDVRERLAPAIQSENSMGVDPVKSIEVFFEIEVCSANINTAAPVVQSYEIGEFNRA